MVTGQLYTGKCCITGVANHHGQGLHGESAKRDASLLPAASKSSRIELAGVWRSSPPPRVGIISSLQGKFSGGDVKKSCSSLPQALEEKRLFDGEEAAAEPVR